jgi:acyl carrier protein
LNNFAGTGAAVHPSRKDHGDTGAGFGNSMRTDTSQLAPTFGDRLAALAPNQRRRLVIDQIRRDSARVLGLENLELVPNNKPLNELGLDSLMAVDLRNGLANTIGHNLPATLLFDYPTVNSLAEYLSRSILGLEEAPEAAIRPSSGSGESDVLDEIENLDEDEIDRLLQQRGTGTQ